MTVSPSGVMLVFQDQGSSWHWARSETLLLPEGQQHTIHWTHYCGLMWYLYIVIVVVGLMLLL